jgi:hypothetical protein
LRNDRFKAVTNDSAPSAGYGKKLSVVIEPEVVRSEAEPADLIKRGGAFLAGGVDRNG